MSELGQNRKCLGGRGMSALPPEADIAMATVVVQFDCGDGFAVIILMMSPETN
jgi:hypothetical protein